MESISEKIIRWHADNPDGPNFNDLYSFIIFRNDHSFAEYHPTIGPVPRFEARLGEWISNLDTDDDQQQLLKLVKKVFFIGSDEFISLYRAALNENIVQWIIDLYGIDIFASDASKKIKANLEKTWFCPITDSMHIADFCHVNSIHGNKYRPDWRALSLFGSHERVTDYMQANGLENLVLLEDFIGTGSQILGTDEKKNLSGAVPFVGKLSNKPNVLIVPLVICEHGVEYLQTKLARESFYKRIKLSPVLTLPGFLFINQQTSTIYPEEYSLLLKAEDSIAPDKFKYGCFGYKDTGSPVVMYTNCPDNTISPIYQQVGKWKPLFPRASRV